MSDFTSLLPPLTDDEYEALKADIAERGCLVPVEVDENGELLDGAHRTRACQELGLDPPLSIQRIGLADDQAKRDYARKINLLRRHLTTKGKRELIAGALVEDHARSDRAIAGGLGVDHKTVAATRGELEATGEIPQLEERQGLDGKTRKQPATKQPADPPPDEPTESIFDIKDTPTRKEHERSEKRRAKKAEHKGPVKPPEGRYHTIVIDPPWPMEKIERDVRPNQTKPLDYPPMSIEELAGLKIPAADDAHLYLWTTHKFLPDALRLTEAWGFRYQCLLTWCKNVGFTPFSFMYSTEHVIFARRGSLDLLVNGRRLDFEAKVREHSRKPNEFYELVAEVSPGPRLDMYAREEHEGFKPWGNETERFGNAA